MPKRKTSSGPVQPQQGCSDGAKMLIEQMKEHPEEFRGYGGKFANLLDAARDAMPGTLRNVWMSKRDAAAILAAADEHLYEVWLAEDVLTRMMTPKEEPVQYQEAMRLSATGSLGLGTVDPRKLYVQNTASNTITAQYDQAHQRLLAKRAQESIERQEREYALRNTKPFKDFL